MHNIQDKSSRLSTTCMAALSVLLTACNSADNSMDSGLAIDQVETTGSVVEDRTHDLRAFCPRIVFREGGKILQTYTKRVKKNDPDTMASLKFQYTITDTVRECNYSPENLHIRVGVRGQVINGPSGASGDIVVPVLVEVADISGNSLYSNLNQSLTTIPPGGTVAHFKFVDENINLRVPEKDNLIIYVSLNREK